MARWEAEYGPAASAMRPPAVDEGLYEPAGAVVTDDEIQSPAPGERKWYSSNLLRLIIVVVVLAVILFLVLRACSSRPASAPGAQTTPLATATSPAGAVLQPTFTPTVASAAITTTLAVSPTLSAATPQPAPTGGKFEINQRVEVAGTEGEGIRFRTGPGLSYVTTSILDDGDVLTVVGGPETVDGFTWWRLQTAAGAIGWAVENNLQAVSQ